MEKFFSTFSGSYFFVLSTKDYNPAATKEFYCLCFNDTDNHDQKSENLLVQLLRKRDDPSLQLQSEIPLCRYAPNPFKRIKGLIEHYLQDHTLKLHEFLNHIAFSVEFHDQRMVNMACELLLTWREKERERSKNSPKFNLQDASQLKAKLQTNSAESVSFSFLGNTSDRGKPKHSQPMETDPDTIPGQRFHNTEPENSQYLEPVNNGAIDMSLINTRGRSDPGFSGKKNIPGAHSQSSSSAISKPDGQRNCRKSSSAGASSHQTNPPKASQQGNTGQSSSKNTRKPSTSLYREAMSQAHQMSKPFSNHVSKRIRPY